MSVQARQPDSSTLRCPSCGHANRAAAKFCEECGKRLPQVAASVEPPRAPRDYTPRHLAEKILGSRAALEGERKQVTVLFADVKGSMELASAVGPEDWHQILDGFSAACPTAFTASKGP